MTTEYACQRMLENRDRLAQVRVLAIGGANVEHGYTLPGSFESDAKYTIEPEPRLAGGSSVNHACRLLAMGVEVDPVLPLARKDPQSRVIVAALDEAGATGASGYRVSDRALNLGVEGADLLTPYTTIIREGASRTVLNEFSAEMMLAYREHVAGQLERVALATPRPDVVMIGHVHADRPKTQDRTVGFGGAISEEILTHPGLAGVARYVNFGSAQFGQGARRWGEVLRDHVDVFQLDIAEVRRFCRDADIPDDSLESILAWFRERCTVVVSLGRFGAIGQLVGSDQPVIAWPYLIDDVVDSTGAGDAMGAGIVASLAIDPFLGATVDAPARRDRFERALAFGRACGAFACTTQGGATSCPSLDELLAFEKSGRLHAQDRGPEHDVTTHDLFLIDRAFDHR